MIWDDHDYGINDGGGSYRFKEYAQNLYIDFYILINLSFIFLVYLFVDHPNVTQEFILKTGIERIIFNISPIIILVFIEIINKKKSIFNKYYG